MLQNRPQRRSFLYQKQYREDSSLSLNSERGESMLFRIPFSRQRNFTAESRKLGALHEGFGGNLQVYFRDHHVVVSYPDVCGLEEDGEWEVYRRIRGRIKETTGDEPWFVLGPSEWSVSAQVRAASAIEVTLAFTSCTTGGIFEVTFRNTYRGIRRISTARWEYNGSIRLSECAYKRTLQIVRRLMADAATGEKNKQLQLFAVI